MRLLTLSFILLIGSSFTQPSEHSHINFRSSFTSSFEEILWQQLQTGREYFILPDKEVLTVGAKGYFHLLENGQLEEGKPLAVIDFSLPSTEKRLWIIDMEEGKLIHHGYVAHGRNSGELKAERFSNQNSSYMSSLGFYRTAETYQGKHGYSLRLDGLEQGFNDRARERAIVIHGAAYASEDFIRQTGRLGRSLGCPALPPSESAFLINHLKEGALLFIYAEDEHYLSGSSLVNVDDVGI
ncbi:murein L,D-transpeptidase catalytic domain family protein [Mongoliitalea daihaiensis]|uniref:murein L,D-transpeptidase catalytic domain family protein n=1 Tax=Mongoliitalea daihaiensis TaxID=2782006 RepID=UPI001F419CA5|nr:murein L,D-transpeptidase catalytic domain family protein [Mongoliitalea daihaiensis]UJP64695.1 murein L,D-transpeptidase catalytic domain family protein [Mongoliitalea daihaiensis]